jgi:outer membrane lipoprotein-sorting protein
VEGGPQAFLLLRGKRAHREMTRIKTLAAVVLFAIFSSGTALSAELTPIEILERMDKTINGYSDQTMEVTMVIVDVDGSKKSYDSLIYQKGDVKRLIIFTSGENKGMATLIEDKERIYAYLPGFKKVRRVASHNLNQSFAGSDFTNQDMAASQWTREYDCRIDHEDQEYWYLSITPKPGTKTEYARSMLKVDKKGFNQMGIDHYNQKGEHVKKFVMSEIRDFNGVQRASIIVASDPRTGHHTELHLKSFKVNQNLKDDMFTVRQLQWGK